MHKHIQVRGSLQSKWHLVEPHQPGAVLVFQGLRVRMGINSGIYSAADCQLNKAAGRMHYTGVCVCVLVSVYLLSC
jgi:hypothetical protein